MDCYEPGQIIISPGPEFRSQGALVDYLQRDAGIELEPDYSLEEILLKNDLEIDDATRSSLPFVARVPEGLEEELSSKIRELPAWAVAAALPNYSIRPSASAISIDFAAVHRAVMDVNGSPGGPICGRGCSIAIIDSGIDPQLIPGIPRQFDALSPGSAAGVPFDPTGHGSLVAKIVSSIVPAATIFPIRAFDNTGALSSALAALYMARALGCHVINMSFSLNCSSVACGVCGNPNYAAMNQHQLVFLFKRFLDLATDMVLVAAAGNNVKQLALPAALDSVIAVGSFDYLNQSTLSNYTQVPVDRFVLAPGGVGVAGKAFAQRAGYSKAAFLYGTSFATAFVTAFAAKVVCARNSSNCGTPITTQKTTHVSAVIDELKTRSSTNWTGFDTNKHGLGALRF